MSDNECVRTLWGLLSVGGAVTLSSPDHVALITHALFNVSIPRTQMPDDWRFEVEENAWIDGDDKTVEGELEFEVTQYDLLRTTLM